MTETWRPVSGYEGLYEVSDQGHVRSLDRRVRTRGGGTAPRRGKVLSAKRGSRGYPLVTLCRGGIKSSAHVHSLMMLAFRGEPHGRLVRHLDGDQTNNVLTNLAYGSGSDNSHDSVAHGTHRNASKVECIRGHPFNAVNTYIAPDGSRRCRQCRWKAPVG